MTHSKSNYTNEIDNSYRRNLKKGLVNTTIYLSDLFR